MNVRKRKGTVNEAMSTSTEYLSYKAAQQTVAVLRAHCHQGDGSAEVLAALAEELRRQLDAAPIDVRVEAVAQMLIMIQLIMIHRSWTEDVAAMTEDKRRIRSDWVQVGGDLRKAISRVGGELRLGAC